MDPEPAASLKQNLTSRLQYLVSLPRIAVASDVDGTLAYFQNNLEAVTLLPNALTALTVLAALQDVTLAIVSGRSLAMLQRLVKPSERTILIGSHGAEIHNPLSQQRRTVTLTESERVLLSDLVSALTEITGHFSGTYIETKPTAAALHTRRASRKAAEAARKAVLKGPGSWDGVIVALGHEVVEIKVREAHKGPALREALQGLRIHATLYMGDDRTDEDVFEILRPNPANITIKVGQGPTLAQYRLSDPHEAAALLLSVAHLRRASSL